MKLLWVAAAGPGSNVAQAALWALVARVLMTLPGTQVGAFWMSVAEAGIAVNVAFAILNLFPLLPLDGGRIVMSLLPNKLSYEYSRLEPYGMIILLVLILTGVLGRLLVPLMSVALRNIYSIAGLG